MEKTHSDSSVTKCKIIATGIALPSTCVTSAELDSRFGKAVGYVEKRCGIVHRYHASLHDSQAGLAAQALQLAQVGAHFIPLDLTQARQNDCIRLMTGCDAVWYCAAKSSPWGKQAEFFLANVLATRVLAQAAGHAQIPRFIHISTPAVYFDFQHHYILPESYRARAFSSHYANSKFQAEQEISGAVTRFPATTFVLLRPRGLFGPHDNTIVPRILQQLQRGGGVLRLPRGGDLHTVMVMQPILSGDPALESVLASTVGQLRGAAINLAIFLLQGLHPLLLWALVILAFGGATQTALLLGVLAIRHLAMRYVQRAVAVEIPSHPLLSLLSELLQPFHLLNALVNRTIYWRSRRYRIFSNDWFTSL
uniref:NAD-dependent epimerase/dehydratase family protein n=1 Tax=Citrobacter freundii TaxID=546 RepID=UPI0020170804